LPSASSSRRAPCVFGLKGSGFCTASFRANGS
jgi:hypothetical protein